MRRHRPGTIDAQQERARLDAARRAEIELRMQAKRGDLVPLRDVQGLWASIVIAARTGLLAIPSQLKGRRPDLTPADLRAVDALLREVLEELASGGSAALEAVKP